MVSGCILRQGPLCRRVWHGLPSSASLCQFVRIWRICSAIRARTVPSTVCSFRRNSPWKRSFSRLGISKGSASQGLRQLEELGAILRARKSGERSHTYIAMIELKPLLAGFLHKRLTPRLAASAERLQQLEKVVPMLSPSLRPTARLRLRRITKWHKRAHTFLPLAQKLLQAD